MCSITWPVGLMDKASASGAGDSRFESWAGQACLQEIKKIQKGGQEKVLFASFCMWHFFVCIHLGFCFSWGVVHVCTGSHQGVWITPNH